jgi:peptide/nickel transport system ATP-binding protein
MSESRPALRIENLSIAYRTDEGLVPAVRKVSLATSRGQTMGLVGESGSGKTTLALGAVGYLPANGRVTSGRVTLGATELSGLSRKDLRHIWGSRVGMVSQNPQSAFNPSLTIGRQLDEMGRQHLGQSRQAARATTLTMLEQVDMPDPASVVDRYPHQLSGGMLQRAAIAMALLTTPELLILDEPTTALDVTTQALVLDLLQDLKSRVDAAMIYITHNLGVVAQMCERVAVMYAGQIVEQGPVEEMFARPLHPYTINLLNCVPRFGAGSGSRLATIPGALPNPKNLPTGCTFAPRCPLVLDSCLLSDPPNQAVGHEHFSSCLRWQTLLTKLGREQALTLPAQAPIDTKKAKKLGTIQADMTVTGAHLVELDRVTKHFSRGGRRVITKAVDRVSTSIDPAKTLGLVGESGSGKTTLARVVAGLTAPTAGRVALEGQPLAADTGNRGKDVLRRLQMVFQSPDASLNPRQTIGEALLRPLLTLTKAERHLATDRAHKLLEAVRLPASYFCRYPVELSGGEKQRVAIARAFAAEPDLVICDEPISSLDVSVQGSLMNLLVDLQTVNGTSYLFISHDLAAVQHLSHRIAVMYLGALMEQGDADRVLAPPYHPYTEALLSAIPIPNPGAGRSPVRLRAGAPSPSELPPGCRFHPRCPRRLGPICETQEPPWRVAWEADRGHGAKAGVSADAASQTSESPAEAHHAICCHIPLETLLALQTGTGHGGASS